MIRFVWSSYEGWRDKAYLPYMTMLEAMQATVTNQFLAIKDFNSLTYVHHMDIQIQMIPNYFLYISNSSFTISVVIAT